MPGQSNSNAPQAEAQQFRDSSPSQRIFRKILQSGVSEGSSVLLLLFGVLVARGLGPAAYGEFTYALAYGAVFALAIDAGLVDFVTRELSRNRETGRRVLRSGLGFQLAVFVPVEIVLVLSLLVLEPDITSPLVVTIVSLAVACRILKSTLRAILRGCGRFDAEAVSMLAERTALVVLGVAVLTGDWSIVDVVIGFTCIKIVDLLTLSLYVHYRVESLTPDFDPAGLRRLIVQLLPFSMTMVTWVLYNYADVLMLGYFRGSTEVGQYGAIYQFFAGIIVIPSVVGAVFLPWMSYEYEQGKSGVERVVRQGMRLLLVASVPVVAICVLAPRELILLFFGAQYAGVSVGLTLLLVGAPVVFLLWFFRRALIAIHRAKSLVLISVVGVLFNIAANMVAIPLYGLYGACGATLVTEILTYLAALRVLHREDIFGPGSKPWVSSLLACAGFGAPLYVTYHVTGSALLGIPIGFALGHLILCRLGYWNQEERNRLKTWHLAW